MTSTRLNTCINSSNLRPHPSFCQSPYHYAIHVYTLLSTHFSWLHYLSSQVRAFCFFVNLGCSTSVRSELPSHGGPHHGRDLVWKLVCWHWRWQSPGLVIECENMWVDLLSTILISCSWELRLNCYVLC